MAEKLTKSAVKKLKDYNLITIEVVFTKTRGVYGYQCRAFVYGGEFTTYLGEGKKTTGCGYDKTSWAVGGALKNVFENKTEWSDTQGAGLSAIRGVFKKYGFKQIIDINFDHSNSYIFAFQRVAQK